MGCYRAQKISKELAPLLTVAGTSVLEDVRSALGSSCIILLAIPTGGISFSTFSLEA